MNITDNIAKSNFVRRYSVFLLYAILAVLITLNLLLQGNHAIVGEQYQGSLPLWLTWYPLHALSNNYDIAFNNYAIYPIETNWTSGLSLVSSTFYLIARIPFGPVMGYHFLLTMFLLLNAATTFIFLKKKFPESIGLAAIGGLILAFNPITWGLAVQGQFMLLAFFPIIMAMLAWDHLLEAPSIRRGIWVTLAVYLVVLTSIQFWNFLITLWLPYAIYTGWKSDKRPLLIDPALYSVVIFGFLFAIFPASQILWSTYAEIYSPFAPWLGRFRLSGTEWVTITRLTIGVAIFSLIFPWRMNSERRLWSLIAFGNVFFFHRETYAPLHLIPRLFEVPHFPEDLTRTPLFLLPAFFAATVMFISVLSSLGEQRQWAPRAGIVFGVILVIASGWNPLIPTTPIPDMNRYAFMANEPEDYAVATFPMGVDSLAHFYSGERQRFAEGYETYGFTQEAGVSMMFGVWYNKRTMGGLTESITGEQLEWYKEMVLPTVVSHQFVNDETIPAAQQIREDFQRLRIAYVIVPDRTVAPTTSLFEWLNWTGTYCQVEADEQVEIWQAAWHPNGCPATVIDIGSDGDTYAVDEGWFAREDWGDLTMRWAGDGTTSEVTLWATPRSDYAVKFRAFSPHNTAQVISVQMNGEVVGTIELTSEWAEYEVILPRTTLEQGGLINVELEHSVAESIDGRVISAAYDYVVVEAVE